MCKETELLKTAVLTAEIFCLWKYFLNLCPKSSAWFAEWGGRESRGIFSVRSPQVQLCWIFKYGICSQCILWCAFLGEQQSVRDYECLFIRVKRKSQTGSELYFNVSWCYFSILIRSCLWEPLPFVVLEPSSNLGRCVKGSVLSGWWWWQWSLWQRQHEVRTF